VLVCIFDDATVLIYAFSPSERFSLWELVTTDRKTIGIKLSKSDIFNKKNAKRFIWEG